MFFIIYLCALGVYVGVCVIACVCVKENAYECAYVLLCVLVSAYVELCSLVCYIHACDCTRVRLTINNTTLPTDKNIKILRLTFDYRHTFEKHGRQSEEHHKNTKSSHHYALEKIQGNTTKHIHYHH